MEIPNRITDFLKKNKMYYQVLVHPKSFTSSETAEAGHVSGKNFLKAVMVKVDGKDAMVVLPSNRTIDFLKLTTALRTRSVYIEAEKEFKDLFPDCEVGAMPPVGRLYGLSCYIDESIRGKDKVYLNAGNHEECIEISADDFLRAVKGILGDFSVEGKKIHEEHKVAV